MSRAISLNARIAATARETGEVFLVLLTLSHPDMMVPVRLVSNTEAITSRGQAFVAFPFDITLPQEGTDSIPEVRLTVDNVDRQIMQMLRSLPSAPDVLIEIVLASSPDVVEYDTGTLKLFRVSYDALSIQGTLSAGDFLGEPFPAHSFTRTNFSALF